MKALALLVLLAAPAAAMEPLRPGGEVAFLGIHFIDTSAEGAYFGVREDETARMELIEGLVAGRFDAEGFALVDLAPVEEELARTTNPADCYGCDLRMGAKLGADYVLVGEVQKVSNLIIVMNLVLREVERQGAVRGLSVDIRSNTDESWQRGIRFILDRHFFPED